MLEEPQARRARCQFLNWQPLVLLPCYPGSESAVNIREEKTAVRSTIIFVAGIATFICASMSMHLTLVLMVALASTGSACHMPGTCDVSPALMGVEFSPHAVFPITSPGWASNLVQSHSVTPEDECPCTLYNSRNKPCDEYDEHAFIVRRCYLYCLIALPCQLVSCWSGISTVWSGRWKTAIPTPSAQDIFPREDVDRHDPAKEAKQKKQKEILSPFAIIFRAPCSHLEVRHVGLSFELEGPTIRQILCELLRKTLGSRLRHACELSNYCKLYFVRRKKKHGKKSVFYDANLCVRRTSARPAIFYIKSKELQLYLYCW